MHAAYMEYYYQPTTHCNTILHYYIPKTWREKKRTKSLLALCHGGNREPSSRIRRQAGNDANRRTLQPTESVPRYTKTRGGGIHRQQIEGCGQGGYCRQRMAGLVSRCATSKTDPSTRWTSPSTETAEAASERSIYSTTGTISSKPVTTNLPPTLFNRGCRSLSAYEMESCIFQLNSSSSSS